ncbi:MAG: DsbE family thiol:disulfide interchange protein [Gammaproteobacteria bacterium]|nr:DsbE family thiol:disulfide interchange protein [Gammaproteobacteria bacterium]
MIRYAIPIAVFVVLVVVLGLGLGHDPRYVPSPFIGKPAPHLNLTSLDFPDQRVTKEQLLGRPWVLNVFASWCATCGEEVSQISELAKQVTMVGMNKEDRAEDARRWLQRHGNPYAMVLVDSDGKASIDWGVYAVPETFIVDKKGIVRYKYIGAITETDLRKTILPLIQKLMAEPA